MGIGDIFRPKHKHSDVAVRAAAVRELSPAEAETLAEVAREDDDPGVRAAAIDKIPDPELLLELAAGEPLDSLRKRAGERAAEILADRALAATDEAAARQAVERVAKLDGQRALAEIARRASAVEVRAAALGEIRDPKTLADLARSADDPETRAAALDRIEDVDALRAIAVDETRKEVGLAALERIDDPSVLEVVAAKAKHRGVRSRAGKRLTSMRRGEAGGSPEKRSHAERVQLCRVVEKLSRGHEWVESYRRVTEAEARWRQLGDGSDVELRDRFRRAYDRYLARYESYGKTSAEAVAARRREQAEAQATERDGAEPPAAERAEATEPAPAEEPSETPAGRPEAGEKSPPAAARGAGEKKSSAAEQEKNLAELEALTARVDELAGGLDKLKTGERWLSRAEKALKKPGPLPPGKKKEACAALEEARRKLLIRVGELREAEEWKRWANVPKQEELIARVEALLSSEDRAGLAAELKRAQAEWKQVGPTPRDRSQELWERFKSVCDQVYALVKEQRAQAAEVQKENLRLKEELCARAEEISESTDWGPAADKLKRLQAEWKKIGPVPRRQSDKIWKRFRAACDTFFERRRPHLDKFLAERTGNLEKKQALCAEIEALAESGDPEAAERSLGDYKRRFRQIGPVPQKELSAIQERFREACDRVKRRRDEERERERAERLAELEQARAALEEALAAQPGEGGAVAERTLALRAAQKKVAGGGQGFAEARRGAEELCVRAVAAYPDAFRGTDLDPEVSKKRKEKLVARIEELVPAAEQKEQAPASPEEMAERLRAALADRALGGVLSKAAEARPVEEVVREARESWSRLGPVPGPEGAALEERFEQACRRARGSNASA